MSGTADLVQKLMLGITPVAMIVITALLTWSTWIHVGTLIHAKTADKKHAEWKAIGINFMAFAFVILSGTLITVFRTDIMGWFGINTQITHHFLIKIKGF